jgi:hypothetical protein
MDLSFEIKADTKNIKEHPFPFDPIWLLPQKWLKSLCGLEIYVHICSHALRPEGAWVGEIHVRIPSGTLSEYLSPAASVLSWHGCHVSIIS